MPSSWSDVLRSARGLDGVVESTSYGTPALRRGKKLFARLKEDGVTVVLRTDPFGRAAQIAAEPDLFFLTAHYRDHPWVLFRLERATGSRTQRAVHDAWSQAAPTRRSRPASSAPRRPRRG